MIPAKKHVPSQRVRVFAGYGCGYGLCHPGVYPCGSLRFSRGLANCGDVELAVIDDFSENITRTIIFYTNQTLRIIALCYKDSVVDKV